MPRLILRLIQTAMVFSLLTACAGAPDRGGTLALPAVVRRVIPGGDGGPSAVILAPTGWGQADWQRLDALLRQL